jgi:hypothetical protein
MRVTNLRFILWPSLMAFVLVGCAVAADNENTATVVSYSQYNMQWNGPREYTYSNRRLAVSVTPAPGVDRYAWLLYGLDRSGSVYFENYNSSFNSQTIIVSPEQFSDFAIDVRGYTGNGNFIAIGGSRITSKLRFQVVADSAYSNGVGVVCRPDTLLLAGACEDFDGTNPLRSASPITSDRSVVSSSTWVCMSENAPAPPSINGISGAAICYDPAQFGQSVTFVDNGTWSATSNDIEVSCPAGTRILGGGCQDAYTSTRLRSSAPNFTTPGWSCRFENAIGMGVFVYAACVSDSGPPGLEFISSSQSGASATFTASCSAGKRVIGGGCADVGEPLTGSAPSTPPGWRCRYTSPRAPAGPAAFAICASP